jgi:hypothetical protein
MARCNSLFRWRKTRAGFFRRIVLKRDMRPSPAGMVMNACRTFATTDSNSKKGIPKRLSFPDRSQPDRIVINASRLSVSSQTVLWTPSKVNPSMSFSWAHEPSSFASFLLEIGSASSLLSGGKTSWIPNMTASE